MKRRLCIISALAVLILIAVLVCRVLWPPLPSYKGQSLAVWFRELPATCANSRFFTPGVTNAFFPFSYASELQLEGIVYGTTNEARQSECFTALRSIGTNAIPYAISKLARRPSWGLQWLEKCARKVGFRYAFFRNARAERGQALTALLIISPLPDYVLADLQELSTGNDADISTAAKMLLWSNTSADRLKGMQKDITTPFSALR